MVYVEPVSRAVGDLITSAIWNQDVVENTKAIKLLVPEVLPSGVLMPFAGASAPGGWLMCDGSAVSRATYSALYAVIGTVYGVGDGTTTFNVPDLRGRMPLGKDNMGGASANRVVNTAADNLGQGSGAELHILTEAEMPVHNHGLKAASNTSGPENGAWAGNSASSNTLANQGSGSAHNNMPPYLTLNYLIKT